VIHIELNFIYIIDFKVPKLNITFKEKDFMNLLLKYQCEHGMDFRFLIQNNEFYTISWVDYSKVDKAFRSDYIYYIDKTLIKDKNNLN